VPPPTGDALEARTALAHLDIRETSGTFRAAEPVSHGVAFPQGVLSSALRLRAWKAGDGSGLAIQARPLSHWPDGSVRWALVDTRLDLNQKETVRVAIGLAPDLPPQADPFGLRTLADGSIQLDAGDRQWDLVTEVDTGNAVAGLVAELVDRLGNRYRFEVDRDSVELIESGALRAVVRLRGEHVLATRSAEVPEPFHTATVWIHVQAGLGTARVEWSLENTPLQDPPGRLAFKSYSLYAEPPEGTVEIEVSGRRHPATSLVEHVQAAGKGRLTVDGKQEPSGKDGDLWMGLLSGTGTLHVHRVESLRNHPTSVSWLPGLAMQVGLLAETDGIGHYLDDATRKTFRLHLVHDAGKAGGARVARLENPAHASLVPEELAASGAWGDTGHLFLPRDKELRPLVAPPRDAPDGWADWGEANAKNTHQSGSPRNRLSVFLEAVQSGDAGLFRWAQSRAWHAMDLRPYHIDGFDADEHPKANLYEGIPHSNEAPARRLGRSEMAGRFPEWKTGLPAKGHGYNGFDPEHMTLDDVYECWLLTGSWPALSALRSAGEAMLTWKELVPDGTIHSSRTFGWTLRALVQVFRATGEARYLEAARRYVARADDERGKGDVKYLRSNKPDGRHIADKAWDDPWMVAVALHGLAAYWQETGDERVPPMLFDLTEFCLSAYRGTGFLPDVPLDGSPIPGEAQSMGTSSWVPGGLAAAAFVLDDHRAVDAVLDYYALLREHTSKPVRYGGDDWHWWQSYLVSLEQRHGRKVVEDPKSLSADR
jgi:hypothetical protein